MDRRVKSYIISKNDIRVEYEKDCSEGIWIYEAILTMMSTGLTVRQCSLTSKVCAYNRALPILERTYIFMKKRGLVSDIKYIE